MQATWLHYNPGFSVTVSTDNCQQRWLPYHQYHSRLAHYHQGVIKKTIWVSTFSNSIMHQRRMIASKRLALWNLNPITPHVNYPRYSARSSESLDMVFHCVYAKWECTNKEKTQQTLHDNYHCYKIWSTISSSILFEPNKQYHKPMCEPMHDLCIKLHNIM